MKKQKIFALLLACVLILLGVVACDSGKKPDPSDPADTGKAPEGGVKIGFVTCNMNDTFQTYIADAAEAKAKEYGFTMEVQDAQEDVIRQQDQVNTLIQSDVDYLIVVPVDTSAMEPISKAATDAGIPLIYVNRNPFGEDDPPENIYYIGSKEIEGGRFQGEELIRQMGEEGGVCILMGILSNEGAIKRTEGNKEIFAQYPGIEILAEETGNWQFDQGMNVTENWITAYGDKLNAIVSNNDNMAIGAIRALEEAGREDVLVIGLDAIPEAVDLVESGKLAATVLQDANGQGAGSIDLVQKLVKGDKLDPVTWIDLVLITKDNVADYK